MPLSDTIVRQAKPRPKAYKLSDGQGLYVEVAPSGSRYWRLKYRFAGKEKRLALGVYPTVSLAKAREDAREARLLLNDGIDPSERKKERTREARREAANAFEIVTREWHKVMRPKWTPHHADDVLKSLEKNIFPTLGGRPIAELEAPEFLRKRFQRSKNAARSTSRNACGNGVARCSPNIAQCVVSEAFIAVGASYSVGGRAAIVALPFDCAASPAAVADPPGNRRPL